jgi:lysophospholipase L1-like esterase
MTEPRKVSFARRLAKGLLLGLLVLVVAGEVAVRIAVLYVSPMTRNVAQAFQTDPVTGFRLTSNMRHRIDVDPLEFHFTFDTNSRGLRGPELVPKAPGEFRVLVLGDSFAFGLGVESNETFSAVLEKDLRAAAQRPVSVVNAGTVSFGTVQELAWLKAHADEVQPDVVVVAFYDNDFADNVSTIIFKDGFLFENPILIAGHPSFLLEFVLKDLLHIRGSNPAGLERKTMTLLEQVQQICLARRIPFILLDITSRESTRWALSEKQQRHAAPVPAGAISVDMFTPIEAQPSTPYLREHHLNQKGHELVASELLPVVLRTMKTAL